MKKRDFSKKIIKILSEKPAVSIEELEDRIILDKDSQYALNRSIKGLKDAGMIDSIHSGQNQYAKLTKEGKKKANSLKLECENAIISNTWDGYWRIILLDIPEERKNEREALRYLLKKAGFACLKNSVWISMYPFEHLFTNIKKDLNLSSEMMIIVTDKIDEATEKEFLVSCNTKQDY
jgi:DNA-binding transcriptional regulator PaaX